MKGCGRVQTHGQGLCSLQLQIPNFAKLHFALWGSRASLLACNLVPTRRSPSEASSWQSLNEYASACPPCHGHSRRRRYVWISPRRHFCQLFRRPNLAGSKIPAATLVMLHATGRPFSSELAVFTRTLSADIFWSTFGIRTFRLTLSPLGFSSTMAGWTRLRGLQMEDRAWGFRA